MKSQSGEIKVQASGGRFSVPKAWCDILGVKGGDALHLTIRNIEGKKLYSGWKYLKSGLEIYGSDIRQAGITPRQRIHVKATGKSKS